MSANGFPVYAETKKVLILRKQTLSRLIRFCVLSRPFRSLLTCPRPAYRSSRGPHSYTLVLQKQLRRLRLHPAFLCPSTQFLLG